MFEKKFHKDINKILLDITELENQLHLVSDKYELDSIENKIRFAKRQLSILETEFNELVNLENSSHETPVTNFHTVDNSFENIKEKVEIPTFSIESPIITEDIPITEYIPTIEESETLSTAKEVFQQPTKEPKEPNIIFSFIKENWKLLFFSAFLFIGIVWLFVYISNLTNFAEELRIGTGFAVSLFIYAFTRTKKLKGNKAVTMILTSYIIGLLSLLFGSVVLEVIPQSLSIIISLIYIGTGIYHIKPLQSKLYEISIIASSLVLTFAYYYVDAPYEILFIYILALVVSLTFAIQKNNSTLSSFVLILLSLFITNIVNNMSHQYTKESFFTKDAFFPIETTFTLDMLPFILPFTILFAVAFTWHHLQRENSNTTLKNISLGSLYVSLITFVLQLKDFTETISSDSSILLPMFVTFVLSILSILYFKKEQNTSLVNFSFVSLFLSSMTIIPHLLSSTSQSFDLFLSIITLALMAFIAAKNNFISLRFMSFYYFAVLSMDSIKVTFLQLTNDNIVFDFFIISNNLLLSFIAIYTIYISKQFKEISIHELNHLMNFVHLATNFLFSISPFIILSFLFGYLDELFRTGLFFLALGHVGLGFIMYVAFTKTNSYYIRTFSSLHFFFILFVVADSSRFPSIDSLVVVAFIALGVLLTISFNKLSDEVNKNNIIFNAFSKYVFSLFSISAVFIFTSDLLREFISWLHLHSAFNILTISLLIYVLSFIAIKYNHVISKIVASFFILRSINLIFGSYVFELPKSSGINLVDVFSVIFVSMLVAVTIKIFKSEISKIKPQRFIHYIFLFVSNYAVLNFVSLYIENLTIRFGLDQNIAITFLIIIGLLQLLFMHTFKNFVTQIISYLFLGFVYLTNISLVSEYRTSFEFLDWLNIALFTLLLVFEHTHIKNLYRNNKNRLNAIVVSAFNTVSVIMSLSFLLPFNLLLVHTYNSPFYLFDAFTLGVLLISIYQFLSQSKEDNLTLFKPSRILIQFTLIITLLSNLVSSHLVYNIVTHLPFLVIEFLVAISLFFLTILISAKYDSLKIDCLTLFKIENVNITLLRTPMFLVSIYSIISLFNCWFISSDILTNNIIVGLSIIYLLFETSTIEKIENPSKLLFFFVYSIIGVYLFILIFVLLADTAFIIRAIVFILIGIYGLFTVLKSNKKELN